MNSLLAKKLQWIRGSNVKLDFRVFRTLVLRFSCVFFFTLKSITTVRNSICLSETPKRLCGSDDVTRDNINEVVNAEISIFG